jgi:hypothetical protein
VPAAYLALPDPRRDVLHTSLNQNHHGAVV